MIVTDKNKLKTKCSPVSIDEGEEIGVRLLHELRQSENGIGLAANQIGIQKRVCVINVKEPLVLINPRIVEKSKEQFVFPEGCLSFPDDKIKTIRHESIVAIVKNTTKYIICMIKSFIKPIKSIHPPTLVEPFCISLL